MSQKPPLPKPWRLQTRAHFLALEEAQKLKVAIGKKTKQSGSVVSSQVRTAPSQNQDSQGSQAGSRTIENEAISNPAISTQMNVKRSSNLSIENASIE